MSVGVLLELGGRTYAGGLMWLLPRPGARRRRWTLAQAREVQASWYAERAQQTGFWTGPEPDATGTPIRSLAHEVAGSIETSGLGTWQALLDCGADRYAIVRGQGGEILATGDRVIEGRAAALEAFAAEGEWSAVYATPGLVDGARVLKLASAATPCALEPVPFARAAVRRRAGVAVAALLGAGGVTLVLYWAWQWYEQWSRVEVARPMKQVEEIFKDGVDVGGFLAGCESAWARSVALPPMWESTNLGCYSESASVAELSDALSGGVLFQRWRMRSGANVAMSRRVAESRLSRWDVGEVLIHQAWGAMEVEVPVRTWTGEQPSTVAFRAALDRSVGTLGEVTYAGDGEAFVATIRTGYPMQVVRERLGGLEWVAARSVVREGDRWRFEVARVEPRVVVRMVEEETQS